jgi:hypothetical protein
MGSVIALGQWPETAWWRRVIMRGPLSRAHRSAGSARGRDELAAARLPAAVAFEGGAATLLTQAAEFAHRL